MKIIAQQVPPEYQESPLFLGDEFFPDNVAVFGNRDYKERTFPAFDRVYSALYEGELLQAWDDLHDGHGYKSWADALADLVPAENRGPYTREERKTTWYKIMERFEFSRRQNHNEIYCKALELMTGKAWETATIRGCCQGDWQEIIYPAEYGPEWLQVFETEYFNTGSEWQLDPDGENVSCYVTSWKTEDIKKELANAYGCKPEEITLLKFTGWTRSANYEEE
jgi:hypothetical protein